MFKSWFPGKGGAKIVVETLHKFVSRKIYKNIFFFENKLTGKYVACAEASTDSENLVFLSHDQWNILQPQFLKWSIFSHSNEYEITFKHLIFKIYNTKRSSLSHLIICLEECTSIFYSEDGLIGLWSVLAIVSKTTNVTPGSGVMAIHKRETDINILSLYTLLQILFLRDIIKLF